VDVETQYAAEERVQSVLAFCAKQAGVSSRALISNTES
jgi:hypothetical protein